MFQTLAHIFRCIKLSRPGGSDLAEILPQGMKVFVEGDTLEWKASASGHELATTKVPSSAGYWLGGIFVWLFLGGISALVFIQPIPSKAQWALFILCHVFAVMIFIAMLLWSRHVNVKVREQDPVATYDAESQQFAVTRSEPMTTTALPEILSIDMMFGVIISKMDLSVQKKPLNLLILRLRNETGSNVIPIVAVPGISLTMEPAGRSISATLGVPFQTMGSAFELQSSDTRQVLCGHTSMLRWS